MSDDSIDDIYRRDVRAEYGIDSKGDVLRSQAEKAMKKLFGGVGKYHKACELYEQAASCFKAAENWREAAECYVECAQLLEVKIKSELEACACYCSAARCYRNVDAEQSTKMYDLALSMHMAGGRFSSAAKIYRALAEMDLEDEQKESAIQKLEKAFDCLESAHMEARMAQTSVQIADLCASLEQWTSAADWYEKAGRISFSASINKASISEYYFKSLMCRFVVIAPTFNLAPLRERLDSYLQEDRRYDSARDLQMLTKCIKAFENDDVAAFTKALSTHNKVKELDDLTSKCMLYVKRILKAGPSTGAGVDDDDAEFV